MHLLSTLLSTSLLVSAGYCSSVSHALDARAPAVCNSADIAIVKANALQPIYFCRYYVSDVRTRSALPGIGPQELRAACDCLVASAPKTTAFIPLSSATSTSAVCVASDNQLLDSKFTSPKTFCEFYNSYPRDLERMSPVNGLSIASVQKTCRCIKAASGSSTSLSSSRSTATSSTTSSSASPTGTSSISSSSVSSTASSSVSSTTSPSVSSTTSSVSSTSSTGSTSLSSSITTSSSSLSISSTIISSDSSTSSSSSSTATSSTATSSDSSTSASSVTTASTSSVSVAPSPTCTAGNTTNTDGTQWNIQCDTGLYGGISSTFSVANLTVCESKCKRNCAGVTYNPRNRFCRVMGDIDDIYANPGVTAATYLGYNETYAAMQIIESRGYQPFCSSLLSYTTTTVTTSTTMTMEQSTSTSVTTTTEITAQTAYYKHKRSVPLKRCDHSHDYQKRQAAGAAPGGSSATTTADALSTPAPLVTFAAANISSACSAEATPVTSTTVTSIVTISETPLPASTVSTSTVTSTTTISIASNAPTGVVGYLQIVPQVNNGANYVMSDAAGHMTDNSADTTKRETHIVTSSNQLYSVTHNSYYYYSTPGGNDLIYWTTSKSQASTNWFTITNSGTTELVMSDPRTSGAYYNLCLKNINGDGGSTGKHFYFLSVGAAYPTYCTPVRLYFEAS